MSRLSKLATASSFWRAVFCCIRIFRTRSILREKPLGKTKTLKIEVLVFSLWHGVKRTKCCRGVFAAAAINSFKRVLRDGAGIRMLCPTSFENSVDGEGIYNYVVLLSNVQLMFLVLPLPNSTLICSPHKSTGVIKHQNCKCWFQSFPTGPNPIRGTYPPQKNW